MVVKLDETMEIPSSGGKGKFAKLDVGDNVFRFMDTPVVGYLWWDDNNSCHRVKTANEAPDNVDLKYFWQFPVYIDGEIRIMDITQKTVLNAIQDITKSDPGYSDLGKYDIKVTGTGEGMERKYTVVPLPVKAISKDGAEAWKNGKDSWDPKAVFENGSTEVTSDDNDDDDLF